MADCYCAKCGKTIVPPKIRGAYTSRNGWRCVGCMSWFCLVCHHNERECVMESEELND